MTSRALFTGIRLLSIVRNNGQEVGHVRQAFEVNKLGYFGTFQGFELQFLILIDAGGHTCGP